MKIAIFYHCLFYIGEPPKLLPAAPQIVARQNEQLKASGLLDCCEYLLVGVNGGKESLPLAKHIFPKAVLVMHGLESRSENLTILELEKWLPAHPDWLVLYFHSKGATRKVSDPLDTGWRNCMMRHLVVNWRKCVKDLNNGYESVGCHWLTNQAHDKSQNLWGGNFWWAKASFLNTLPSMMRRDRIRVSGIGNIASRYEAEVWIGNGPRLPKVKDYHPSHPGLKRCL